MNWITTKTGKHIPVPDDEEQKKRQIDYNQKQADKLNKKESQGKGKKQISKKDELDNKFTKEKREEEMKDKKPIAWITRGGKHIPIFEQSSYNKAPHLKDDEISIKEQQIAKNKAEADKRNGKYAEFGKPGVYKVYRSGKTKFKEDNYPVFFSREEHYAREYSSDKNMNKREFGEYEIEIKNPYIVNLKASERKTWEENPQTYYMHEEQAGPITAYNQLFGTDYTWERSRDKGVDAFLGWETAKSKRAKMQGQRDREIMDEVLKRGYDSIIYKYDRPQTGNSGIKYSDNHTRSKEEIIVPASKIKDIKPSRYEEPMEYRVENGKEGYYPFKKKGKK